MKKKLEQFVMEYRTKKTEETPELKDVKGKDEDHNGSEGLWAVEPPTEDDIAKGIDRETLNKNKKRILMRMKSNKPFFVQGEAGWGKTSIITKLAHQCGRTVITVYLDKAEATDLGGIPVPTMTNGKKHVEHLLPQWAAMMANEPKTKFLLFFDEMNQAAPDVMNALMPIVLKNEICGKKFDNFIVGAAGNFESENGAINELSGPLKSRFGGVIVWESGDWDDAFSHLHKKWDEKLDSKMIDKFKEYAHLFKNPRDVESFLIETVYELKKDKDYDMFDVDDYVDQIEDIVKDDLSRTEENQVKELAEAVFNFMKGEEKAEKGAGRSGRGKDMNMIPENVKKAIKNAMTKGYIAQEENGKTVKYGVSKENILDCVDLDEINREMAERLISKFETDGLEFKYKTNEEWKKAGLKDPDED